MATETTFAGGFSGRLPVPGSSKVPGAGLKVKYGAFTIGSAEYPNGGYTAADLETLVGFSHIECIVPCGYWMASDVAFGANWDGAARKLQALGNIALDGNALTVGTEGAANEMATNDASLDGAVLYALVIGF